MYLFHDETRRCELKSGSFKKTKDGRRLMTLEINTWLEEADFEVLGVHPEGLAAWSDKVVGAATLGDYDVRILFGQIKLEARDAMALKPVLSQIRAPEDDPQQSLPGMAALPAVESGARLTLHLRFDSTDVSGDAYKAVHNHLGLPLQVAWESREVLRRRIEALLALHNVEDLVRPASNETHSEAWLRVKRHVERAVFEQRELGGELVAPFYRQMGILQRMGDVGFDELLDSLVAVAHRGKMDELVNRLAVLEGKADEAELEARESEDVHEQPEDEQADLAFDSVPVPGRNGNGAQAPAEAAAAE